MNKMIHYFFDTPLAAPSELSGQISHSQSLEGLEKCTQPAFHSSMIQEPIQSTQIDTICLVTHQNMVQKWLRVYHQECFHEVVVGSAVLKKYLTIKWSINVQLAS